VDQTKTKMISGPFYTYGRIHLPAEMLLFVIGLFVCNLESRLAVYCVDYMYLLTTNYNEDGKRHPRSTTVSSVS